MPAIATGLFKKDSPVYFFFWQHNHQFTYWLMKFSHRKLLRDF